MKNGAIHHDLVYFALVSFCPEACQSGYSVNLVKKIPNSPRASMLEGVEL